MISYKRILSLFLLIITLVILFFFISYKSSKHTLKGNFITLVDNVSQQSIQSSPETEQLVSVKKEKLSAGWKFIGSSEKGNRIWKTYASKYIVSLFPKGLNRDVRLFRNGIELKKENELFKTNADDGWNFIHNQVFVQTKVDHDPSKDDYFIDYQTFSKIEPGKVSGETLDGRFDYGESSRNWKMFAYPTRHPLWITNVGSHPNITIYRDKTVIPFQPDLLDTVRQNQTNLNKETQMYGWNYFDDSEEILFQSSSRSVLRFTGDINNHVFKNFMKSGVVSLLITAKADLIEPTMPRLAIYLDGKQVDSIDINSDTYRQYSSKRFVLKGDVHEFRFELENSRNRRFVSVMQLVLVYSSAFVIAEPKSEPHSSLIANYETNCSFISLAQYLMQFGDKSKNSIVIEANYGGEVRRSIPFMSNTRVSWEIKVPSNARLNFDYAVVRSSESFGTADHKQSQLKISIKKLFSSPEIIYSTDKNDSLAESGRVWKSQSIDLSSFAGQTINLIMDTASSNRNYCPSLVYVSDPTISTDVSEEQPETKQIILISADALRADHLGSYGYFRNTSPYLDRFAKESIVFENAISQASWTLPSFGSLFTSLYPSFHCAYDFETTPLTSKLSLVPLLKNAGFHTAAFVNNPCLNPIEGFASGFDRYDFETRDDVERIERALRWVESVKKQKFFLFIHFLTPHEPYSAPPPFSDAFDIGYKSTLNTDIRSLIEIDSKCKNLSEQDLQFLISQYDAEILYLDSNLNHFLQRLKELGIYKNAMIVFLSDHGESFREHGRLFHGYTTYQEEIHIPLIMKFPDKYDWKGRRISSYVKSIDIFPTILNFASLNLPDYAQGRNLHEIIVGNPNESIKAPIFAEVQYAGETSIIQDGFKYIHTDLEKLRATEIECFPKTTEELYDLRSDLEEKRNVILENPALAEQFRKIKLNFDKEAALFLKKFPNNSKMPFVLEENMKEELRALGYIH